LFEYLEEAVRVPKDERYDDKGSDDDDPTGNMPFVGELHMVYFE
jgi:hypothetical protein